MFMFASATIPNPLVALDLAHSQVHYFRPREFRTAIYHEILIAYLDYVRQRGFHTVSKLQPHSSITPTTTSPDPFPIPCPLPRSATQPLVLPLTPSP